MNEFVNLISNVDSFTKKEFYDKLEIFFCWIFSEKKDYIVDRNKE